MEILQTILTDIWEHINSSIDWVIVLLVISSGYVLGRIDFTRKLLFKSQTLRVIAVSLGVTLIYAIFTVVPAGKYIASYFIAFGFHTVIIKWIDRRVNRSTNPSPPPPPDDD